MSDVKFKTCKLFDKTFKEYKNNKQIVNKFKDFVNWKTEHPNEPFGGKDYSFGNKGNLVGYSHTGLSFDISLIYKKTGNVFQLYGFFSHDESGTGTPANINRQQSLKSKLDHQEFA